MIVQINKDNSSDYNGWFSEITDAFKNSGNPEIENIVIDNMVACELVEKRIKRHEERLKYFRIYLSTLTLNEQQALYTGVASDELTAQAYDEIHEIETAICFKEQLQPPEEKIILNDDPLLDLDLMIGALAL